MKKTNTCWFIRFLQRQIMRRPLILLLCLLVFVYASAVFLIMVCEEVSFGRATSMVMPAILGELGTVESRSFITQISILAALLVSIAGLAIVTAKITSSFVEFCRRGGSIVEKVDLSNHIVICGWNFQGERIVNELLLGQVKPRREIVVLANCESRPIKEENVEFVKGDPTQDESLVRAGITRADSVIVLSDLTKSANEADAEALMIVLAVESLNREVHSCVQIANSTNRVHFERAHADEIICLDQIGGNLVVASALNHGTSKVVSELLTFNSGSEFYRYEERLSDELIGKEFSEAVQVLARKRILLLGVETEDTEELRRQLSDDILHNSEPEGRAVVINPQRQYKIRRGDILFLIAESAPVNL
jgi:voltage-gated potassium channel